MPHFHTDETILIGSEGMDGQWGHYWSPRHDSTHGQGRAKRLLHRVENANQVCPAVAG